MRLRNDWTELHTWSQLIDSIFFIFIVWVILKIALHVFKNKIPFDNSNMKFLFNHSSKQFLKTKKHFIFILKINLFKKTLKNCFENLLNIFLKLINSFNKSIQTGSQDPIHSGQIKNRSRTNYTVLDILIKII